MRDFEQSIAEWRRSLASPNVGEETLDELESHLREMMDEFVRAGLTKAEAFQRAVKQLGTAPTIASEFQKLEQPIWWPIRAVAGLGVAAVLTFAILSMVAFVFDDRPSRFLLAFHVFMVGLGYTTTFLVGALGICFVGQRCFSEFSPFRTRSLTRVTLMLACVAPGLTAIGIILGMFWAKAEWGWYWSWDAKEIGAFAVILWQLFFLFMHRFVSCTARGILMMSLLGNIVVSLGWFGSNLVSRTESDWALHHSLLLLAGVAFNLVFFITGLAPAGWLRLRKTS